MHLLGLAVAAVLLVINTFGAWAVSRRKPAVARLFLLSAMVLTVAGVAFAFADPAAKWILIAGGVLGYVSSFLNARLVIGKVVWTNHVARGAVLAVVLATTALLT